jgi:hypothetical protein
MGHHVGFAVALGMTIAAPMRSLIDHQDVVALFRK